MSTPLLGGGGAQLGFVFPFYPLFTMRQKPPDGENFTQT